MSGVFLTTAIMQEEDGERSARSAFLVTDSAEKAALTVAAQLESGGKDVVSITAVEVSKETLEELVAGARPEKQVSKAPFFLTTGSAVFTISLP